MRKTLRSRIVMLPMLALLLLVVGCSGTPLSPEQPSGQTSAVSTDPGASNSGLLGGVVNTATNLLNALVKIVCTTVNGLLGGVVRNGDWTVTVPPGAYTGTGVITVTVSDPSVRKVDLSISPASLNNFQTPVTLTCKLQTLNQVQNYVIKWWDPSVSRWRDLPTTRDTTKLTVSATLPHFSTYSCGGKAGW